MDDRQLIILGLVIIGIVVLWYVANKPQQTTEYDARNFVINDAKTRFPEADISVVSVNYTGNSWKIKVKATNNPFSQCPERIHLYYDYPEMKFETQPPEYITKNCRVCLNFTKCTIIFPEEAIIASHTFPGTENVVEFLRTYPAAIGNASYRNYGDYSNVWVVEWRSGPAKEIVVLDENGRVLETKYEGPS